jgi:zinc transport system ATP-binding protein
MSDTIVDLANVWVWRGPHLALRDVSLKIGSGKFIGLMGPNGSGKTTLLKVIVGLIKPDRGRVTIAGPLHRIIGYVPQEENIDHEFPMTAYDVVDMGLSGSRSLLFAGLTAPQTHSIEEALALVGMERYADRRIGHLSGGQKQRVFIARAIVGKPQLLLLDEPTTGVDAKARDDFYRLLSTLMADLSLTIILASHDLEVVPTRVDEIICINQKVFVHAPPGQIEDADVFREAYGCELEFMTHGRHPHRVIKRHEEHKQDD